MQDSVTWQWIETQVEQTAAIWHECACRSPQATRQYHPREQRERERAYDKALHAIEREARHSTRVRSELGEVQNRIVEVFARFSSATLDLDSEQIDCLTHGFLPVGAQFARWARNFDSSLGHDEIVQACRNAWTACGMQPLLGERMELTPSILAYSLLYPYSDNYLDREDLSSDEKLRFSERFRQRLRGETLTASDRREAATWTMVSLIEEQYSRDRYPQVYECLLAIHRAQEQSIAQLSRRSQMNNEEILRTTFAKGGSSVLADACLARGWLEQHEARFAFEWGILLQLGDDLQDLSDDMRRGSATLFTRAAQQGAALDEWVRQLLCFGEQVVTRLNDLSNGSDALKNLLRMSWRLLILGAIADAHKFFSPQLLREAERSSPFRFDFLRARKKRMVKQQGLYASLFDLFLLPDNGPAEAWLPSGTCLLPLAIACPRNRLFSGCGGD